MAGPSLRVTMAQVAKAAGVSRATVSRALSDSSVVDERTRDHVLAVADQLGYVRNAAATQLAGRSDEMVGLLLRDTRNPAYSYLYTAMLNKAQRCGLFITMMSAGSAHRDGGETDRLRRLLSLRPAGILVCSGLIASDDIKPYADQVPTIVTPRPETSPQLHNVAYDEVGNGRLIADYVADRGHKKVAVVLTEPDVSYVENLRGKSMCEALTSRGVQVTVLNGSLLRAPTELAYRVAGDAKARRYTAVMFPNDSHALTFLMEARKIGLKVPEDVGVTGLDGAGVATMIANLTTVEVPIEGAAEAAIRHMRDLINSPTAKPRIIHETFRGTLVPGGTI